MIDKEQKHLVWEVTTWVVVMVVTTATITFFPWYTAENVLQIILGATIFAIMFWYFRNRQLYFESRSKSQKLLAERRKLKARQAMIDLIYENSTDGILVLDNEQRIESFSSGMEKITGYEAEEVLGRLAAQILKFKAVKSDPLLSEAMSLEHDLEKPYITNFLTTKSGQEVLIEASYIASKNDAEHRSVAIVRSK